MLIARNVNQDVHILTLYLTDHAQGVVDRICAHVQCAIAALLLILNVTFKTHHPLLFTMHPTNQLHYHHHQHP